MILRWLRQRRRTAEERRASISAAEAAFQAKYPDKVLLLRWSRVLAAKSDFVVVQVCEDWGGKPPHRSWWTVTRDGACAELPYERARKLTHIPPWR